MGISNCASSGADSFADPITGVVSRKNKITGQIEPASVRAAGVDESQADSTTALSVINEVAKPTATLSDTPTLSPVTQTAVAQFSTQFQQALTSRESIAAYSSESAAAHKTPEDVPSVVDISL